MGTFGTVGHNSFPETESEICRLLIFGFFQFDKSDCGGWGWGKKSIHFVMNCFILDQIPALRHSAKKGENFKEKMLSRFFRMYIPVYV
jgi:hypothetical protein